MTLREWLSKYNFSIRREARGFNIENGAGNGRYVQCISDEVRLVRFISDNDILKWLQRNSDDEIIPMEARDDIRFLVN